jgi:hypothetical protein
MVEVILRAVLAAAIRSRGRADDVLFRGVMRGAIWAMVAGLLAAAAGPMTGCFLPDLGPGDYTVPEGGAGGTAGAGGAGGGTAGHGGSAEGGGGSGSGGDATGGNGGSGGAGGG